MPDRITQAPAIDVLALGELRVDMVANKIGPLAESPTFTRSPGGSAATVATGVVRLGRHAATAGLLGDDPFGRYVVRALASYGVDTSLVRFHPRARTSIAFLARDLSEDGSEETIPLDEAEGPSGLAEHSEPLIYREGGADQLLSPSVVPHEAIAAAQMLVGSGISLASPLPRAALHAAIKAAHKSRTLVVFDASWRPRLWQEPQRARDMYREMLPQVDVFKLSTSELIMLTRGAASTEVRRQEALLQAWIERMVRGRQKPLLVALTRGAAGCSFALWKPVSGLQVGHPETIEIEVKDRAGAGDAFLAAMLVALLDRLAPQGGRARRAHDEAAQIDSGYNEASPRLDLGKLEHAELDDIFNWANTAGALATAHKGAIAALPNRSTILRMIKGLSAG